MQHLPQLEQAARRCGDPVKLGIRMLAWLEVRDPLLAKCQFQSVLYQKPWLLPGPPAFLFSRVRGHPRKLSARTNTDTNMSLTCRKSRTCPIVFAMPPLQLA